MAFNQVEFCWLRWSNELNGKNELSIAEWNNLRVHVLDTMLQFNVFGTSIQQTAGY